MSSAKVSLHDDIRKQCAIYGRLHERILKSLDLDTRQIGRLQGVILSIVAKEARTDFRAYRRLAARVLTSAFEQRLLDLTASSDAGIQRRASWVLDFVRRHPRTARR